MRKQPSCHWEQRHVHAWTEDLHTYSRLCIEVGHQQHCNTLAQLLHQRHQEHALSLMSGIRKMLEGIFLKLEGNVDCIQ